MRILIVLILLALTLPFAPKYIVHAYASYLKADIISYINLAKSDQDKAERFAKWASKNWLVTQGSTSSWQLLLMLPKPLRPSRSAINFLSGEGWCSQFVNAGHWLFGAETKK